MPKLHKKLKKLSPHYQLDRESYDAVHPMGTQAESAYDAKVASEKALKEAEDPEKNAVIPLADEDELDRVRRRRAARRSGGRSSTIMTDDDRLGG